MTILSDFKLVDSARPVPTFRATPVEKARQSVLTAIETQRKLATAERDGTTPNLTKTVIETDADGNQVQKVVPRKPRRWFFTQPDGQYAVEVLYGGKPLTIADNKTAILAGDIEGVLTVLDKVANAVQAGEFDKILEAARANRKAGRSKKKAG